MEPTFEALRDAVDRIRVVGCMPQGNPSIEETAQELERACAFATYRARALGRDELVPLIGRVAIAAIAKFTNRQWTADPQYFAYFEPACAELFKALEGEVRHG